MVRQKLGITVQTLTADVAEAFGLAAAKGVLISDVDRGGPAAAGLQRGMVITSANRQSPSVLSPWPRWCTAGKRGKRWRWNCWCPGSGGGLSRSNSQGRGGGPLTFPEQRGSDAHQRGAFLDGRLEIAGHAMLSAAAARPASLRTGVSVRGGGGRRAGPSPARRPGARVMRP